MKPTITTSQAAEVPLCPTDGILCVFVCVCTCLWVCLHVCACTGPGLTLGIFLDHSLLSYSVFIYSFLFENYIYTLYFDHIHPPPPAPNISFPTSCPVFFFFFFLITWGPVSVAHIRKGVGPSTGARLAYQRPHP